MCPGVFMFLSSFHGLSLLSALADVLHSVRCCWWAADPSVHSWGLGDATKSSHPAGFAWEWPWGSNSSLQSPLGHQSWQRESSLGDAGSREGDSREQGDCVGSVTAQVCCSSIHKECLIAVTLWNALICTGSQKTGRVGGDFVVHKVLGEFLRIFMHQAGGDFYKTSWLCCVTQSQPGLALIQHTAEMQSNKLSWAPLFLMGRKNKSFSIQLY